MPVQHVNIQYVMFLKCGGAGLIGSVPTLPYESAMKYLVFDNVASGLSEPCPINSPKWGGSPDAINVQALFSDLQKYQACLPNFLFFDVSTSVRQAYTDDITCPVVKWMKPNASASVQSLALELAINQYAR